MTPVLTVVVRYWFHRLNEEVHVLGSAERDCEHLDYVTAMRWDVAWEYAESEMILCDKRFVVDEERCEILLERRVGFRLDESLCMVFDGLPAACRCRIVLSVFLSDVSRSVVVAVERAHKPRCRERHRVPMEVKGKSSTQLD